MQSTPTTCIAAAALSLATLALPSHAQTRQICFTDERIVKVSLGAIEGGALGNDNGNAVYFLTGANRWYSLNWGYNMDDSRGRPLVRLLLIAKTTGMKVTAIDSYPPFCDDVDTIHLRAG